LSFTNLIFDVTALAVRYEGATATEVSITGGTAGLTAENGGAGSMTFASSVNVDITVVDSDDNPIQNVRVGVFTTPGGTQVMNELTNASGFATEAYTGSTPQAVSVRLRKNSSADNPRYFPVRVPQTISTTGLVAKLTMVEDTIVA